MLSIWTTLKICRLVKCLNKICPVAVHIESRQENATHQTRNFMKGKKLIENTMNEDQNTICTSLLDIKSISGA